MSRALKDLLVDRIARFGPMPFDEYMERCLYHPIHGFYAAGDVRPGITGDFVTSPEVSPWFGRLLGRWARGAVGSHDALLIEVGSGAGSLLEPLLDETATFFAEVWAVEASAASRAALAGRTPSVRVVASVADLPEASEAVVIVNEVLDNMPVKLVERTPEGFAELRVGVSDGVFHFVTSPADAAVLSWCNSYFGDAPTGAVLSVQMAAARWLTDVIDRLPKLHLCVIDYAADTKTLARRRREDVVRTYRRHRSLAEVLESPGDTDITVDVNVDVVRSIVAGSGAGVSVTDQRSFLMSLGAGEVLSDLTSQAHVRAQDRDFMGQLKVRSEVTDLTALLQIPGFGSFTVFCVTVDPGDSAEPGRHR